MAEDVDKRLSVHEAVCLERIPFVRGNSLCVVWTRGCCRIHQENILVMRDWAVAIIAAALLVLTIAWSFFVIILFWP
jgi:hypothetical protein